MIKSLHYKAGSLKVYEGLLKGNHTVETARIGCISKGGYSVRSDVNGGRNV